MPTLSRGEVELLQAVSALNHRGVDEIAHKLGYRPARKGRLATTARLRALMRRHGGIQQSQIGYGETSQYIYRSPPKDRWDHARWGLTNEAQAVLRDLYEATAFAKF